MTRSGTGFGRRPRRENDAIPPGKNVPTRRLGQQDLGRHAAVRGNQRGASLLRRGGSGHAPPRPGPGWTIRPCSACSTMARRRDCQPGRQTDGAPGVGCADLPVCFRDICFCQVLVPPNTCPCVQNEMLKTLAENKDEVYRHRRGKVPSKSIPMVDPDQFDKQLNRR